MQTKTITVPNIGCAGCVRTIESEVRALPGVTQVKGQVDTKQVLIEWDTPASWEQIQATLVEIEYPPAEA